jgi:NAD(P)-dependent dehydrogenase (short-subunit alcohol dehydrogenase family)
METAMPQSSRKVALVTGSTDGVGRFVAERLGADNWDVIVHGRDAERGAAVVATIAAVGGAARFFSADLSDLAEVRRLAEQVAKTAPRLDLLINNAGLGTGGAGVKRQVNAAGVELRFAVNYLAGFALTMRLLPLLKGSAPARIVNVASVGQQAIDFDDVMLERGYSGGRAYTQSKLAQVMFTIDLAERLKGSGVAVNCLHPATYMATTMVRQAGVKPWSTVEEGGQAILQLAQSPAVEGRSGLYFNGLAESRADPQAYDAEARAKLWALSLKLTGLKDEGI